MEDITVMVVQLKNPEACKKCECSKKDLAPLCIYFGGDMKPLKCKGLGNK